MILYFAVASGGGGGGAVYVTIGGDGSTSDTHVTLTDCNMSNNTASGELIRPQVPACVISANNYRCDVFLCCLRLSFLVGFICTSKIVRLILSSVI